MAELQGQVEKVTYTNIENSFTIAQVKVQDFSQLVTVIGNLPSAHPGEELYLKGDWITHPRYGKQFKVTHSESRIPATTNGIQKYLGSGLIKGIGPTLAKRIVQKFGAHTLELIDNNIERLSDIDGIGKKRIAMISQAWLQQKEVRSVMLFLQQHAVSPTFATKIFTRYASDSIHVVKENPYRLAEEIFGIGFLTADRIAGKLGFGKNSKLRAESGVLYILHQLADKGHLYYPFELLVREGEKVLQVSRDLIMNSLDSLAFQQKIVIENLAPNKKSKDKSRHAVYLAQLHHFEVEIARQIKSLYNTSQSLLPINEERAIHWVQKRTSVELAAMQVNAIKSAVRQKITVITGGPGTGKTTVINAIVKVFRKLRTRIFLAAPTGRAAKRMNEATGHQAQTIHRMLKYSPQKGGFQKNDNNLLKCDLLIIDEASMIDSILMYHLLKALSPKTTLILVGDVHQLPSVGPGNTLKDIINSATIPVVELDKIFRQAQKSRIVVNAHRINQGLLPHISPSEKTLTDFYFIEQEEPDEAVKIILSLAKERIPRRFGFNPLIDIQVLTPMHRGIVGATNLNSKLQQIFNPTGDSVTRGNKYFRLQDKVMQIRNNYDKEVFNGDIGHISGINQASRQVIVTFDEREVLYDFSDLDEIVLAYAISVHKSQGSEYPAIVIPILRQHYLLLQRNLIYTAITRAKHLAVIVGSWKALSMGIKNDHTQKRHSHLYSRLQSSL